MTPSAVPPTPPQPAAGERVVTESCGVAVCGLGRAGQFHVERLRFSEECRLLHASDPLEEAAVPRPTGAASTVSFAEVLRDDRVQLVVISAAPAARPGLARDALAAGKHVLIDAPAALTSPDLSSITEAAVAAQRSAFVCNWRRADEDYRAALSAMAAGMIGAPCQMHHRLWQYSPELLRDVVSMPWSGSGTWADDTLAAIVFRLGWPVFDQLMQLIARPWQVVHARELSVPNEGVNGKQPSGIVALISWPDGGTAEVSLNLGAFSEGLSGWSLTGSTGGYARFTTWSATSELELVDLPQPAPSGFDHDPYANITRRLRSHGPDLADLDDTRRTLGLVEAVLRSAASGCTQINNST